MVLNVKALMEAANAVVPRITPAQAQTMIAKGNPLVVDVRDAISGAVIQSTNKPSDTVQTGDALRVDTTR